MMALQDAPLADLVALDSTYSWVPECDRLESSDSASLHGFSLHCMAAHSISHVCLSCMFISACSVSLWTSLVFTYN